MDFLKEIGAYIMPAITAIAGWFGGKWQRKKEDTQTKQDTVDMLTGKIDEMVAKVISMQEEVIKLREENSSLRATLKRFERFLSARFKDETTKRYERENNK